MTADPSRLLEGCRLAVFDLDGTLYRQGPVRRAMLRDLLLVGGPPGRVARLRVLRRFRQLREEMAVVAPRGFDGPLFARLAAETGQPEAALRALVREWMDERPLPYLRRALVAGAAELLPALRERGIVTAIWSDYPVPDKLAALGLAADHVVSALDRDVGALKPDPAGLALLLTRTGLRPDQALMIGDRTSHDGRAAAALSVPFLLRARKAPPGTASVADFRSLVRGLGAA